MKLQTDNIATNLKGLVVTALTLCYLDCACRQAESFTMPMEYFGFLWKPISRRIFQINRFNRKSPDFFF